MAAKGLPDRHLSRFPANVVKCVHNPDRTNRHRDARWAVCVVPGALSVSRLIAQEICTAGKYITTWTEKPRKAQPDFRGCRQKFRQRVNRPPRPAGRHSACRPTGRCVPISMAIPRFTLRGTLPGRMRRCASTSRPLQIRRSFPGSINERTCELVRVPSVVHSLWQTGPGGALTAWC